MPVSLSLLCLCACLARPAAAQGNHWAVSYSTTGSIEWHTVTTGGIPACGTRPLLHHAKIGGNGCRCADATLTANVTATLTWVDSNGNLAPDPPRCPTFREYGEAMADNLGSETYLGHADNGLGDAEVDDGFGIASKGAHLIRRDGSSGVVTLVRTLTATLSVTDDTRAYLQVDWGYYVVPDLRGTSISSDIDPTYHKGPDGSRVLNERDGDGTMHGDTVRDTTVTYNAGEFGNWSAASDFHWYESLHGSWMAGFFEPTPVPELAIHYDLTEGGTTDHLHIRLTDSDYERATATGNYYMTVHRPAESFQTLTDEEALGEEEIVTSIIHPEAGGDLQLTISREVSVTTSATAQASLTVDHVCLELAFESGRTFTSSTGYQVTYHIDPGKYAWVSRQPYWRHRSGVADTYGVYGFEAVREWTADSAVTPANPLIDFIEHCRQSDAPPLGG